jgi:hypothetical protein
MAGLPTFGVIRRDRRAYPHRWLTGICTTGAVIALALLATSAGAQQPGADGPSKALEGKWKLELYLDKASTRTEPMAGQINGEIAFSTKAWWTPSDRFGRHDLNLRSFFGSSFLRPDGVTAFGPGDTSMVTEASGYIRGDSVGIDFIPRVDHGGLSLWGRFWGDSAKGRWYRRGADGEGHFVLRRESREPVDVANIPDGRPTVVAAAAPPPKPLTKAEARAQAKKDAVAKAKAHRDSLAVAAAAAKAKNDSIAKVKLAARDSARAVAAASAKARRDSIAQAKVAAAAAAKERAATRVASAGGVAPNALTSTRTGSSVRTAANANGGGGAAPAATAAAAPATPAPVVSAAPPSTTPGTPGALRVRIFDQASKRFFVTTYSLHLPDGHWMYGNLRTGNGPDGWGPAVPRPPGNYEIEIANFKCGDKLYFFKDKILKQVTIDSSAPADVTVDVDLPNVPARKSLDNEAGASCTVPPPPQPGA